MAERGGPLAGIKVLEFGQIAAGPFAGSLLAALSLAAPLSAQRVSADVAVRSGPVAGRVVVGDGYSTYRRPVVYRRVPARVIVVERVYVRH